jgi:hypothetical protein
MRVLSQKSRKSEGKLKNKKNLSNQNHTEDKKAKGLEI